MTDTEVLLLKIDIVEALKVGVFTSKLVQRVQSVPEERQGDIINIFFNLFKIAGTHDVAWLQAVKEFVNKIKFLKEIPNISNELESIFVWLRSRETDAADFFSTYKILETDFFKYYSILTDIFIQLQLFERIGELKEIINKEQVQEE